MTERNQCRRPQVANAHAPNASAIVFCRQRHAAWVRVGLTLARVALALCARDLSVSGAFQRRLTMAIILSFSNAARRASRSRTESGSSSISLGLLPGCRDQAGNRVVGTPGLIVDFPDFSKPRIHKIREVLNHNICSCDSSIRVIYTIRDFLCPFLGKPNGFNCRIYLYTFFIHGGITI